MKRTHITSKKLKTVLSETREQEIDFKPKGFWYGIDGDWERWCKGEEWGLSNDKPNLEYELVLADEEILTLSSVVEIDAFHDLFRSELPGFIKDYINWEAVAEKYDGIEIAPYQWDRRLEGRASRWYYPWDCASGCIWRPKGVTVKLIGPIVLKG
jgi:hypothetical protein